MKISSIAYTLGSKKETLIDLKKDNPDWDVDLIYSKTGVSIRHRNAHQDTALTLARKSGLEVLKNQDVASIEGLIYITQSPDHHIPATACILHEQLNLPANSFAFDLNQGCSGFVYGLSVASSMMQAHNNKKILIICSETYKDYIDKHDRTNRPIFSDGASAVILTNESSGTIGPFVFMTDGKGAPNLTLLDKSGEDKASKVLFMDGPKVLMFTMANIPRATKELLQKDNMTLDDIDLFIYHQASTVVLDNIQRILKIPNHKFLRHIDKVGNTVSSTIPIVLCEAMKEGKIKPNMKILLMGFGVGYSLAGSIMRT